MDEFDYEASLNLYLKRGYSKKAAAMLADRARFTHENLVKALKLGGKAKPL